jgi:hypothetical protein
VGIDLREEYFFICSKIASAKGLHMLVPTGKKKQMQFIKKFCVGFSS